MAVVDPRTWMEILSIDECWRLVRQSSVGRLAVVDGNEPMIWPLNIAVDDDAVVFRTGPGSKLATLQAEPRAALEVDGLDFDDEVGWSVVAVGRLRHLAGADLDRARRLALAPWTVGEKPQWFALDVERIAGRAIRGPQAGPVEDIGSRSVGASPDA